MSQDKTSNFSDPINYVPSTSDVAVHEKEERRSELLSSLAKVAIGGGAIYSVSKYVSENDKAQELVRKLFNLKAINSQYRMPGGDWNSAKINKKVSLGEVALNAARYIEDISPFKILRTFHTSSMLSPIVTGSNINIHVKKELIDLDRGLYASMLEKHGAGFDKARIPSILDNGMILDNGSLFEAVQEGDKFTKGGKLVEHARLVNLKADIPGEGGSYFNRVYEKYRNVMGIENNTGFYKTGFSDLEAVGIISGRTKTEMYGSWTRAYGRLSLEPGYKIFDNPAEFLSEFVDKTGVKENKAWQSVKKNFNLNFFGGDYTKSTTEMMMKGGKSIIAKPLLAAAGFYALDRFSKNFAPEESAYSKGIISGISTTAVNARVNFASVWSDNFQELKKNQEYVAPGSTDVSTLIGFPLAGAMLGGTLAYGGRVKSAMLASTAQEYSDTLVKSNAKTLFSTLEKIGVRLETTNVKKWALGGAILGALPILPYLPGALVGRSSEELIAEYSGEKEVAVKANRWWSSGSYEFGGTKTKYYRPNWYASMMSNAEDVSLYGSEETKDDLNPLLNPFDYLRNPYRVEQLNSEDRPYPVWGMDVSFGSFFGKLFEKTVGALIKPDLINPELAKYSSDTLGSVQLSNSGSNAELKITSPNGNLEYKRGIFSGSKQLEIGSNKSETDPNGSISLLNKVSTKEKDLIDSGLMSAPESASYDPTKEAVSSIYKAGTEFAGLKGWIVSLTGDSIGLDLEDQGLQLARSGEQTNLARDIKDMNLGGMMGLTESQRRFIPTSAGSLYDRANPIKNNMPSWMPSNPDEFFIDFSSGNPYTKVEKGELRLPGKGYASIHKELEGLNPEDYPDIYKYKILSDVALGSDQYYQLKNSMEKKFESSAMSEQEAKIFTETRDQLYDKSIQKTFHEYKDPSELEGVGLLGKLKAKVWEFASHNAEQPLESLTFFRPAGKYIHQRSSIEDYQASQLGGSDVAMWTNPYSHFIKPTFNKLVQEANNGFVPGEVEDRRNINEYFEALDYMKWNRLRRQAIANGDKDLANQYKNKASSNLFGASASRLSNDLEVTRAYMSFGDNDKPYFASFSNTTDEDDRQQILSMLPGKEAQIVSKIWSRKDILRSAEENGSSAEAAINVRINQEEKELASENSSQYDSYKKSSHDGSMSFAEYLSEQEATKIVSERTGVPSDDFIGWDPRIDMNDIKLKTLMLGKEDVREYGFWQSDEERMKRMIGINNEQQVINDISSIKQGMTDQKLQEELIKQRLYSQGMVPKRITANSSNSDNINLVLES